MKLPKGHTATRGRRMTHRPLDPELYLSTGMVPWGRGLFTGMKLPKGHTATRGRAECTVPRSRAVSIYGSVPYDTVLYVWY